MRDRKRLGREFFARPVDRVARDLVGAALLCGGVGGVIVETEAYHESEPSCHAHIGRTDRNRTLFEEGGVAYVYLSYGIHSLLNAVVGPRGEGAAVLIRAIEPRWGLEAMRRRRGRSAPGDLCSGPGKLTQALGISLGLDGAPLWQDPFRLHPAATGWGPAPIVSGPRIGISKATELPWRFSLAGSPYVSRPRPA